MPTESTKKAGRQRNPRKKNPGLTAQEKKEQRKLRNRELAAESRKRKNDEMERLRKENQELRSRIFELELKFKSNSHEVISQDPEDHVAKKARVIPSVEQVSKRSRVTPAVIATVGASLAIFVITSPAEEAALYNTCSLLITTLDSLDGPFDFGFVFALVFSTLVLCIFASLVLRLSNKVNASRWRSSLSTAHALSISNNV